MSSTICGRLVCFSTAIWACGAGLSLAEGEGAFVDAFKDTALSNWHLADYDFTHPKFDTDWRRTQVRLDQGLYLKLSSKSGAANRFDGASIRRLGVTHYGRYEVVMQPVRGEGIVTGFFTYSGPYYGTRHDEIDIEFLGRDTTQMHVAWFVDGVLNNRFIDLGFDAADRPRAYAFEWRAEGIRWFVEDRLVFEVDHQSGPLPQVPGHLFANIWAVDPELDSWAGTPRHRDSRAAYVREVSFEPFAAEGKAVSARVGSVDAPLAAVTN